MTRQLRTFWSCNLQLPYTGKFEVIRDQTTYLLVYNLQLPDKYKDTSSSLESLLSRVQINLLMFTHFFNHIFPLCEGSTSDKSIFWTNQKLSLMVAWSSSVSISCFRAQSSIGHLVWFFDSGNSIVSGVNLGCPYHNGRDGHPGQDGHHGPHGYHGRHRHQ